MNLLLDTHVMLWWHADDRRLGARGRRAIARASEVWVSAASAWEIAIKTRLGKLRTPGLLADAVAASGFRELPITFHHAAGAGGLPDHHRDPFDRMLVAQAREERLTLVTRDAVFDAYDVPTLKL